MFHTIMLRCEKDMVAFKQTLNPVKHPLYILYSSVFIIDSNYLFMLTHDDVLSFYNNYFSVTVTIESAPYDVK